MKKNAEKTFWSFTFYVRFNVFHVSIKYSSSITYTFDWNTKSLKFLFLSRLHTTTNNPHITCALITLLSIEVFLFISTVRPETSPQQKYFVGLVFLDNPRVKFEATGLWPLVCRRNILFGFIYSVSFHVYV